MLNSLRKVKPLQFLRQSWPRNRSFSSSQGASPPPPPRRDDLRRHQIKTTLYYVTAGGVLVVGLSYAAVPLYRMFCQVGSEDASPSLYVYYSNPF